MIQVIVAGVLLLPAALVMIITAPVIALLSLPAAALLTFRKQRHQKKTTSNETYRRAIVTGGSSGIGYAVAQECVQMGFDQVVIIARNMDKLKTAKETLEKARTKSGTVVLPLSVDVSSLKNLEDAAKKIFAKDAEESSTYLFCCAGQATPHRFLDLTEDIIMHNTKTNQLGSMFTVRAMLPHMKAGTVMLCSSVSSNKQAFCFFLFGNIHFISCVSQSPIRVFDNTTDGRTSGCVWTRSLRSFQVCSCRSCSSFAYGTM